MDNYSKETKKKNTPFLYRHKQGNKIEGEDKGKGLPKIRHAKRYEHNHNTRYDHRNGIEPDDNECKINNNEPMKAKEVTNMY